MVNQQTVVDALFVLDGHIKRCGGDYKNWYCGIASNPQARLFNDHRVDRVLGQWAWEDLGSDDNARVTERILHDKGCQGSFGGGDWTTKFVYVYRITSLTVE